MIVDHLCVLGRVGGRATIIIILKNKEKCEKLSKFMFT